MHSSSGGAARVDQPVARTLSRRATAIDGVAFAGGPDETGRDRVQTVVPFARGDREALCGGFPQRACQAAADMAPVVAFGSLQAISNFSRSGSASAAR